MKKGIKFILPVKVSIDLDAVEQIEFIFRQDDSEVQFVYPSEDAYREEDMVCLVWTPDKSALFSVRDFVSMDTRIHLTESDINPETPIVQLKMHPTLFA